jgi:glycosyltransferase involved in cell wall biosynthesis
VKVRMHTVAGLPLMESAGLKRRILFFTEKMTYACATHIYPNSKGLFDFITSNIVNENKKLKVIGNGSSNGIDTAYFAKSDLLAKEAANVRVRFNIGHDEVCFCFVGRLVRDKGIVELVQAFKKLSERAKVKLLLVGSFENDLDPLPKEIFDFISQSDKVVLTGFQRDVRPFMLAANAFVFPSYREGFPNVVLQACCLGVPCIATDINGCNEIIKDSFSGRLVKPKNVDELYKGMVDFTQNQNEWNIRAQRAQEFVVRNFDRKKFWDLLLAEYLTLYEKSVHGRA